MAYTTIDKPTDYFNTVLWTGDGTSSRDITGVGFQPDFTWIKQRSDVFSHVLSNSVTGDNKFLSSNGNGAEGTDSSKFRTFVSDGFQVGSHASVNRTSDTYVGWSWLGGGSASSNTDGDITSSVSANTTAGFSIVSYTGNGSAGQTVGHGLGSKPKVIIVKIRSTTDHWIFYHEDTGATKNLRLNTTDALITAGGPFNNTEPTSSLFTLGSGSATNTNSATFIAYCFAEKKGYSKFGSYTGNGSTNGTFVYTGFKPAWVISKRTNSSGNSWRIFDTKRPGFNTSSMNFVHANLSNAEDTGDVMDLNSNGFKIRTNSTDQNTSGSLYVYMAFAEAPFVSSGGVPTTAR